MVHITGRLSTQHIYLNEKWDSDAMRLLQGGQDERQTIITQMVIPTKAVVMSSNYSLPSIKPASQHTFVEPIEKWAEQVDHQVPPNDLRWERSVWAGMHSI